MYPEKLRVVGQEIWRFTKEHAKYAGLSLLVACAPQPKQEQTQQEPPIPKDAIVLQVTNTPAPELPTAVAEPTATPKPVEPTATPKPPEPTPTPELPRFFQEISVLDIYRSELFIMSGSQRGKFGNILISRLPDNRILVSYNRLKPCEDGIKPTPIFLVRPDAVRGAGFQWDGLREKLVVLLQGPSLGGQIITKDISRENLTCTGNPEPALYSARKQERNGTTALFAELSNMQSEVDSRMTPESVKNIVERLYGGPIPDPAK